MTSLAELAWLFARLGTTAFGGPAAHVAMMEEEVVRRRGWMTREQFLDLYGATNLIPGPNSTELAIHIGHARRGFPGLVVAGVCFILPAALIVTAIAWAYTEYGALPAVVGVMAGIKPVILAIVVQAIYNLGKTAIKSGFLAAIAVASLAASLLGVDELIVLAVAGAAVAIARAPKRAAGFAPLAALKAAPPAVGLGPLFVFFLKIGSVLFGSGYVLLAFLRGDLVDKLHWITEGQLLDAVAVGQVTPGPVFTTATFVGYLVAGGPGAAVATAGIFLPAFVFVAISGPLVPRMRRSKIAGAVLDGVNVASLALMASVTIQLGRTALVDARGIALAVLASALLLNWRARSTVLVAIGALVGLASYVNI